MASIRITMKNGRSSPKILLPTLIKIVFGTVRALVRPHTGQFIGGTFTMAATYYLVSDSRMGRLKNSSERKTEVAGVKEEISGVKADIAVIHDKVEYCQSTVVEGGHHIMKALDGNKKPMRQWLQELEDCKKGSKVDCNPTRKA